MKCGLRGPGHNKNEKRSSPLAAIGSSCRSLPASPNVQKSSPSVEASPNRSSSSDDISMTEGGEDAFFLSCRETLRCCLDRRALLRGGWVSSLSSPEFAPSLSVSGSDCFALPFPSPSFFEVCLRGAFLFAFFAAGWLDSAAAPFSEGELFDDFLPPWPVCERPRVSREPLASGTSATWPVGASSGASRREGKQGNCRIQLGTYAPVQ